MPLAAGRSLPLILFVGGATVALGCGGGTAAQAGPSEGAAARERAGAAVRLAREAPLGRAGEAAVTLRHHGERSSTSRGEEVVDWTVAAALTWTCDDDGAFVVWVTRVESDRSDLRELEGTRYEGQLEPDGRYRTMRLLLPVPEPELTSDARDAVAYLSDTLRRSLDPPLPDHEVAVGEVWSARHRQRLGGAEATQDVESTLLRMDGDRWTVRTHEQATMPRRPDHVQEFHDDAEGELTMRPGQLIGELRYNAAGLLASELEGRSYRTQERVEATVAPGPTADRVHCDMRDLTGACEPRGVSALETLGADCLRAGGRLRAGDCPTEGRLGRCELPDRPPVMVYRPVVETAEAARRMCGQARFVPDP